MTPIVVLRQVSKRYGEGSRAVWALRELSLAVAPGEIVAVMGPSGSGKSTLLNLIGGLDVPTTGAVLVEGRVVAELGVGELARLRRRQVAFVFQFFNLLPTLTAAQNVSVPLRADGRRRADVDELVAQALETVGLGDRCRHHPHQLSGGEMQRVAIARALVTSARVILADEPTGNLDQARGQEILTLLRHAADVENRAVLLVTHDPRAASYADRVVTLSDGRVDAERVAAETIPAA